MIGLNAARMLDDDDFDMVEAAFARMQQAVATMHDAGVPIHVGTDTLAPGVVPGAAFHRELALLVESGFSPEAALAAATHVGAAQLAVEGLGEVRPGAPAELIVFAEDPNVDLAALSTLAAVSRDGRLFDRADLDARLDRFRATYEAPAHAEWVTAALRGVLDGMISALYTGPTEADEATTGPEAD